MTQETMKTSFLNKYKDNLFLMFYITLGSFIIFYTIYRRVILIRIPRNLFFINNHIIDYGKFIFISLSFLICLYIVYVNLSILKKKEFKEKYFSKIFSKLNNIIETALNETYGFIMNFLFSNPYDVLSFMAHHFYYYFKNISETLFLFILYFIKIIILIAFLIDVFVLFRLEYTYKALYLLCISLIIQLLFYMIKDFSGNLENLKAIFIIRSHGLNIETGLPKTSFMLKEEYSDLDLQYYVEQYILCSKVSGYLEYYEEYKAYFTPYFNTIIYLLYMIGWSYVLYKNFILFFI